MNKRFEKTGKSRKTERKEKRRKMLQGKTVLFFLRNLFFIVSALLALIGCIFTIIEYIRIERDIATSFPSWVVFVFYLLPFSILAILFLFAALLCGYLYNRKGKADNISNKERTGSKDMTYGEKIYTLREKNGMSQEELAEKLDVSRQTISNWENDKVKIDIVKAKQLCDVFHIGIEEFCGEELPREDEAVKPHENAGEPKKEQKEIIPSSQPPKQNKNSSVWNIVFWALLGLSLLCIVIAVVDTIKTGTLTIGSMVEIKSSWWLTALVGLIVCAVLFYRNRKHKNK